MKKGSLLLSAALLLSACGFHLRGMVDIPCWLSQLSIISKVNDMEFIGLLKSQLESNRIAISPEPSQAQYWLMINEIVYQKRIVNIGSSTNPRQYQLLLTLSFCLQDCKGEPILTEKSLSITRQLTINNDRILGSNDEERLFMHEMKQQAVMQIMNRLAAIDAN